MPYRALMATLLALALGCGDSSSPGTTGDGGGTGDGGVVGDGGGTVDGPWTPNDGPVVITDGGVVVTDDGGTFTCYVTYCNGHLLECGDCQDNDGDGLVDWRDPECLGPCDNTEGPELTAGVGGETGGPCLADCYFDYGNGPGNDDCHWDHRCDPLSVPPDYPPEGADCAYDEGRVGGKDCPAEQSQQCLDFCMPLTPNGCDCFGCCTFPELNGGYVWIGAMDDKNNGTCTFADILDPSKCPPCTPVEDCSNSCGRCEICIGKPTIPPDCYPPDGGIVVPDGGIPDSGIVVPDGGISQRCPAGLQACGLPGDPECPQNYYCITGCCQPVPG